MNVTIKNLKQLIQSSHINFLYGSGLSRDYLSTLGNIEKLLTDLSEYTMDDEVKIIIKNSLYASYVKGVMEPCLEDNINKKTEEYMDTFHEYERFLSYLNHILSRRNVNLINKQVNLFTTNIDDFMEKAAETTKVELNDGFKGHIKPIFSEDSYSTVKSKSSTLYQNNSAIPVFNLLKIHGSINWKAQNKSEITYDTSLSLIKEISRELDKISKNQLIEIKNSSTLKELETKADEIKLGYDINGYNEFDRLYKELVMINPTKAKFSETVIEYHFYELMRLYSNALERSSSLLIVAGFSFADEHIANITMRAANANPTLEIIVFAYDEEAKESINSLLCGQGINNNNITVISPSDYKKSVIEEEYKDSDFEGLENFDFKSINDYVFEKLVSVI